MQKLGFHSKIVNVTGLLWRTLFMVILVVTASTKTKAQTDNFDQVRSGMVAFRLTNKANADATSLDYGWAANRFFMDKTSNKWKLSGDNQYGYTIHTRINGKYFALAATSEAYVKYADPDANDRLQRWTIEPLPDGYYKISNIGLMMANSPFPCLFYDFTNTNLFLAGWNEPTSLNGRWHFFNTGNPGTVFDLDSYDGRTFSLTSYGTQQRICLLNRWLSDSNTEDYFGACTGGNDRFVFQRAMNGAYLLKVISYINNQEKAFYLDANLKLVELSTIDLWNPDGFYTWTIMRIGTDNVFRFKNNNSNLAMEFEKGHPGNLSRGYYSTPDKLVMKRENGVAEQYWYMR